MDEFQCRRFRFKFRCSYMIIRYCKPKSGENKEQIIFTSITFFPVSPTFFFYFARKGCNFAFKIRRYEEESSFFVGGGADNGKLPREGRSGCCRTDKF